jgi:BirA family biotin operon repressor/biotin-[acetyl-CoA-carboxylase] ligase
MSAAARIVRLARVGSTMDALHALAQQGAPVGTAVLAEEQSSGRGSRGRTWCSPRGGLWLSVLGRQNEAGLDLLSLRVGLAVAGVLRRHGAGDALRLKWPNDLMLGDRKLGGILCEARWQGAAPAWVAIGVGLNVTNRPPAELAGVAACLADVQPSLTPAALAEPVIAALRALDSTGGRLGADERAALQGLDWLRGRVLSAPAPGVAEGIGDDGGLRVRTPDGGLTTVRAGTVVLADLPATAGR